MKLSRVLIFAIVVSAGSASAVMFRSNRQDPKFYLPATKGVHPFCGLVAVSTLAELYHEHRTLSAITASAGVGDTGTSLLGCKRALRNIGIECDALQAASVTDLPLDHPFIYVLRTKLGMHAVVAIRRSDSVLVIDGPSAKEFPATYIDSVSEGLALVPQNRFVLSQ
jgi:ABC-type bacteriocin/lantibiotic exporter with double-glycine peptidase domain